MHQNPQPTLCVAVSHDHHVLMDTRTAMSGAHRENSASMQPISSDMAIIPQRIQASAAECQAVTQRVRSKGRQNKAKGGELTIAIRGERA